MSADLFGHVDPPAPFTDIRNQRASAAEEKAVLCLELGGLVKVPPKSLGSASIQAVRAWRAAHKQALKVLGDKRSSRTELQSAINSMRGYE